MLTVIDLNPEAVVKVGARVATAEAELFPRVVRSARVIGRQVPADAPGDPRRSVLDGIPGKVRVAGCRLNLGVAEQLPDHREALSQGQRPRSIRVPLVMNSQILRAGHADASPRMLQAGEMDTRQPAGNDPSVVFSTGQSR